MFTHWRLAMQAPNAVQKATRLGLLFAYTTAAGAMIQQIKEVLKNRSPADMTTPEFWMRSAILGGGGAILGDFVYNNLTSADGPFSGSSPTAETAKTLYRAFAEPAKLAMGDPNTHVAAKEMEAAWSLLPKPQPMRYVVERMLYDPLLEHVDPAAYARKRDREMKVLGQSGQHELVNFQ
jgi:hypothetical protein